MTQQLTHHLRVKNDPTLDWLQLLAVEHMDERIWGGEGDGERVLGREITTVLIYATYILLYCIFLSNLNKPIFYQRRTVGLHLALQ